MVKPISYCALIAMIMGAQACNAPVDRKKEKPDTLKAVVAPLRVTILSSAEERFAEDRRLGRDVRAVGSEPGWSLTIDNGHRIVFQMNDMDDSVAAEAPNPMVDPATHVARYDVNVSGRRLSIQLAPARCVDPVSEQAFDLEARVTWSDSTYRGCAKTL